MNASIKLNYLLELYQSCWLIMKIKHINGKDISHQIVHSLLRFADQVQGLQHRLQRRCRNEIVAVRIKRLEDASANLATRLRRHQAPFVAAQHRQMRLRAHHPHRPAGVLVERADGAVAHLLHQRDEADVRLAVNALQLWLDKTTNTNCIKQCACNTFE